MELSMKLDLREVPEAVVDEMEVGTLLLRVLQGKEMPGAQPIELLVDLLEAVEVLEPPDLVEAMIADHILLECLMAV